MGSGTQQDCGLGLFPSFFFGDLLYWPLVANALPPIILSFPGSAGFSPNPHWLKTGLSPFVLWLLAHHNFWPLQHVSSS